MKVYSGTLRACLMVMLVSSKNAFAGAGATYTVTWAPLSVSNVPTLSTWSLIMLSVLIGIVAAKRWKDAPNALRSFLAVVAVGSAAGGMVWTQTAESGVAPAIPTSTCTGSIDISTRSPLPPGAYSHPRRLENTCGAPVILTFGECDDPFYTVAECRFRTGCAESGDTVAASEIVNLPSCVD